MGKTRSKYGRVCDPRLLVQCIGVEQKSVRVIDLSKVKPPVNDSYEIRALAAAHGMELNPLHCALFSYSSCTSELRRRRVQRQQRSQRRCQR
mmetsp:Transcript_6165/g.9660  ORF Transcript_6165/g.9660 Transcript_6165/m.9660 type:complete len:92 (+) Transcript_6165:1340-1615(+)